MAAVTLLFNGSSTSNLTAYTTGSFTPANNDLLVVLAMSSGATGGESIAGSVSFTEVASVLSASSANKTYAFVGNALQVGANSQTLTFNTNSASGAAIQVFAVSGMTLTGAAAFRQAAILANQAAGTPAPVFGNAVLTGNPTLGAIANATNPATMIPPTGWTEQSDVGYATPTTGFETISRNSGFTGTTVTWGSSSATAYGAIVVELSTGAVLTNTQSAIARIATNPTKTQSAIARIAKNLTKTQSAISRIANGVTKTQSAISRIANTPTKTQSATARIIRVVTKTQPAISRIANNLTKTQSAVSRISNSRTKTQPAVGRIATNPTKTQSATARILRGLSKTQSAVARIANSLNKTQSAIARIATKLTKTQSTVARIATIPAKTQTAISRIASSRTKTQSATASIVSVIIFTKTQTATARIYLSIEILTPPFVVPVQQQPVAIIPVQAQGVVAVDSTLPIIELPVRQIIPVSVNVSTQPVIAVPVAQIGVFSIPVQRQVDTFTVQI